MTIQAGQAAKYTRNLNIYQKPGTNAAARQSAIRHIDDFGSVAERNDAGRIDPHRNRLGLVIVGSPPTLRVEWSPFGYILADLVGYLLPLRPAARSENLRLSERPGVALLCAAFSSGRSGDLGRIERAARFRR
jgi:hypothetical protein